MKTHSLKSAALSVLCLVASAVGARATLIVDTGTPDNSIWWGFYNAQYFGAEFSVTESYQINSLEGYFSNQFSGSAGTVAFALHADGGNVPGAVINTAALALSANAALDWYGVSGLGWSIGPGTYWVSFMPDNNINGTMPDMAPNPLAQYGQAFGNYNWQTGDWSHLHLGVRIDASAVPEGGSLSLVLAFTWLAGFLVHRRLQRS